MKRKKTKQSEVTTEHYYLSEQGLETLKQNLKDLRSQRKEQVVALATIRDQQSDEVTVEDAGYIYTMGTIDAIDIRIESLEAIVTRAQVIRSEAKAEQVTLGSKVKLAGKGRSFEYTIVHSFEADPSVGKISPESPLGQQLLGKRLWDKITFKHSHRQKPLSLKLVAIQ